MFKTFKIALLGFAVSLGSAQAIEVVDGDIIVKQLSDGTRLGFEPIKFPGDARGMSIQIKGPEGYEAMVMSGKRLPDLDLEEFGKVIDGIYAYQITGARGEPIKREEVFNNGRDKDEPSTSRVITFALSGELEVRRGKITKFEQGEEKGSEKTIPEKEVEDNDPGTKPAPDDTERRPRETDDNDKG